MYFNLCRQIVAAFLALLYSACTVAAATADGNALDKPTLATNGGIAISGVVVGSDGRLVTKADLEIWAFNDKGDHADGSARKNAPAHSDGAGAFEFANIAPGRYLVIVEAKGYTPASVALVITGSNAAPLKIELQTVRTLRGKVLNKAGQAVAGARVSWETSFADPSNPSYALGVTSDDPDAITDANGSFVWNDAPRLDLELKAAASGYAHKSMSVPADLPDKEIQIVLAPLMKVHGVVSDAVSGQPISQYRIMPRMSAGNNWISVNARPIADSQGAYELDLNDLAGEKGPWQIGIVADGYAPFNSRAFKADEGTAAYDIGLTRANWLAGRVTSSDGKPISQAGVTVVSVASNSSTTLNLSGTSLGNGDFTTDRSGDFRLPPQEGDFILAVATPEGFAMATAEEFNRDHRITLQPWARIEGVYLRWNKPAAGQKLTFVTMTGSLRFTAGFSVTDESGRFAFPAVPPGNISIRAFRDDILFWNGVELQKLELKPGETKSDCVSFHGGSLVGQLVLGAGFDNTTDLAKGSSVSITAAHSMELPPDDIDTFEKVLDWRRKSEADAELRSQAREVHVRSDGTFAEDTVMPGEYTVTGSFATQTEAKGDARQVFETDPISIEVPDSDSDTRIDLGKLTLHAEAGHREPGNLAAESAAKAPDARGPQFSKTQGGTTTELSGAASTPFPLPRYRLSVGQEITYKSKVTIFSDGSRNLQTQTSIYRVVGKNPDGSWEVIAIFACKQDGFTRGQIVQFKLWPDGKQKIEASGPETELIQHVDDFPLLPPDERAESVGWQQAVGDNVDVDILFHRAPTGEEPGVFHFDGKAKARVPRNEQDGVAFSNSFRTTLGLLTDAAYQTTLGEEGTDRVKGLSKLSGIVQMAPGESDRYLRECQAFFLAEKEFWRTVPSGDMSLRTAGAAGDILVKARNQATLPELRQILNFQIADLASNLLSEDEETRKEAADRAAVLNKPAPKWDLVDLNGAPHSLSDYLGKVVVLDFWFRGCGWCIKAMPQVKQLAADFANRPVAILGMNTDTDPADAEFVVKELGLNYPVLRASGEAADYHIRGFPTLIIVDRHGVIRERDVGYDPKLHDDVSAIIERLLAEK